MVIWLAQWGAGSAEQMRNSCEYAGQHDGLVSIYDNIGTMLGNHRTADLKAQNIGHMHGELHECGAPHFRGVHGDQQKEPTGRFDTPASIKASFAEQLTASGQALSFEEGHGALHQGGAHGDLHEGQTIHHGIPTLEFKHTENCAADYWAAFRQAQFPDDMQGAQQGHGILPPGGAHGDQLDDYTEVEILADTLGVSHIDIYRANPFGQDREGHINLHVENTSTLEDIRNQILHTWNDLQGRHWKLYKVDDAVQRAYQGQEKGIYVIWADLDLMNDRQPATVLVEDRQWNLLTGEFQYNRRAESVWTKYANINQFYTFLNLQDRCEKAPCPLEVRGIHLHWQDEVVLRTADYVAVHTCTEEQEVRNVIADRELCSPIPGSAK